MRLPFLREPLFLLAVSSIYVTACSVRCELPFGTNKQPDLADVSSFRESRCFPREMCNCRQLLADKSLDEYIPIDIVRKLMGGSWRIIVGSALKLFNPQF
jgi:hypothetical protein